MKLKTGVISRLKPKVTRSIPIGFLLFLQIFAFPALGQNRNYSFSNTSLAEALKKISNDLQLKIAFDAKAMAEHQVTGTFSAEPVDQLLAEILKGSGHIAQFKYGNYLIIPEDELKSAGQKRVFSHISGTLIDRASGEHLPNASILLPDKNIFQNSSANGTFAFKIPEEKTVRLLIKYLGYQPIDSLLSLSDTASVFIFKMKQKNLELNPVLIRSPRVNMIEQNNDAGHSTVNPAGYSNLPNMGEMDIFRTIQLLPGIGFSENSSGLNIRGGTSDQNLVLFDGFTLYNLDHFFGTFSSVNPNVVKDIQILKGGFDSRYGERVSGLIDITGKTGNIYKTKIYGGLNLVSGNLTAEIPFSKKLTLVAAGRRSYADIYSSFLVNSMLENVVEELNTPRKNNSVVQLTPGYYFYDYNAKLTYSFNDQEKMSLSIFGGKDFLSSSGHGKRFVLTTLTTDDTNWGNYGINYSWIKQWRKELFSDLQISYSGYNNDYTNQTDIATRVRGNTLLIKSFETTEKNKLDDFSANLRNEYHFSPKNSLDFGLQTQYNRYSYYKDAGSDSYYADIANSSWLYTSFFQFKNQSINNLSIKLGGRGSFYNLSQKFYFEPRLSGNFRINEQFNLKFATGKYYQFIGKVTPTQNYGYNRDFWVISDDENHPVQSSNHYILGASFNQNKFTFDIETYYKSIEGLQLFLYIPPFQKNADPSSFVTRPQIRKQLPSKFITGHGRAYGIDLLLKYEGEKYTGWISYSRGKSTRNFSEINYGKSIPAPFEKESEFKWTNLVTLGKWNLSGIWIWSSGQSYIEKQSIDKNLEARFTYNKLPDYQRLDIAANYNFKIQKVAVKMGVSIINLLNADNYNDIYSRDFNFDSTVFNETSYVKSMGITPNFFISFQY